MHGRHQFQAVDEDVVIFLVLCQQGTVGRMHFLCWKHQWESRIPEAQTAELGGVGATEHLSFPAGIQEKQGGMWTKQAMGGAGSTVDHQPSGPTTILADLAKRRLQRRFSGLALLSQTSHMDMQRFVMIQDLGPG